MKWRRRTAFGEKWCPSTTLKRSGSRAHARYVQASSKKAAATSRSTPRGSAINHAGRHDDGCDRDQRGGGGARTAGHREEPHVSTHPRCVGPTDLPPENWAIDSASRFDKRGG